MNRRLVLAVLALTAVGMLHAREPLPSSGTLFIGLGTNGEVDVTPMPFQGAQALDVGSRAWLDSAPTRTQRTFTVSAPILQAKGGQPATDNPAINIAIQRAAERHGVDANLLHAVIKVESNYRQRAVSRVGAAGLMQLMPATAKRFGVSDRFNIEQNISGGAAYLRWLAQRFSGDLDLILAAYNAGEGAVQKHGNRIPPYKETRAYVDKVRAQYLALGY